jgi:hypothetical protein
MLLTFSNFRVARRNWKTEDGEYLAGAGKTPAQQASE